MANVSSNRVQDIIKRMDENSSQPEAIKTCFGILAIMSRDESNKITIAREGMETILNTMTMHVDKCDVQESGCDLLWSLSFNNSPVKEFVAKFGGSTVLVRALKRHCRYADFLKSACGALSNMCQCKLNQEGVAAQGGLQPLVGSIHAHHTNFKLLPFIFDALASLIVSNEDNARSVSALGVIPLIISALGRHKPVMDVIKSGCHTLAILTDLKTQASKIALAGGVPIILSLLDVHPSYADLHRVAAVVLLRMLQESAHVARDITSNEGVRILLKSIERGGAQQDTVAAVTHILFSVTNPSSPASACIEPQLWITSSGLNVSGSNAASSSSGKSGSDKSISTEFLVSLGGRQFARPSGGSADGSALLSTTGMSTTALSGVVKMLGQYTERKDVVRAACRLLNNLGGFAGVVQALEKINILDKLLECVSVHTETKDVIDSTALMLKSIHKFISPTIRSHKAACMKGLLHIFRCKVSDEEVSAAAAEACARRVEACCKGERSKDLDEWRSPQGKTWEWEAVMLSVRVLELMVGNEVNATGQVVDVSNGNRVKTRPIWSKNTPKTLACVLNLLESIYWSMKLNNDPIMSNDVYQILKEICDTIPAKHVDMLRRSEKLIALFDKTTALKGAHGNNVTVPSETVVESSESGGRVADSMSRLAISNSVGRIVLASSPLASQDKIRAKAQVSSSSFSVSETAMTDSTTPVSSVCKGWRCPPQFGVSQFEHGVILDPLSKDRERRSDDPVLGYSGIAIEVIDHTHPNPSITLYPRHPIKYHRSVNRSSSTNAIRSKMSFEASQDTVSLLDVWPNYLERLLPASPNRFISAEPINFGGERMHLAYEGSSAGGKCVPSRCLPQYPYDVPVDGCGEKFEHSLTFDSDFESGNLHRAVQRGDATYDLFLRSDMHTAGHTQWFYFAVSNTHPAALVRLAEQGVQVPPVRVRFNIVNLTKPDSLYNLGMRPVVYSCYEAVSEGVGWLRAGYDISYYANSYARGNTAGEGVNCYYTLSFSIEFKHAKDTVLIAYSYPYSFTDYKHYIRGVLNRPGASDIIRQQRLCTTLGGECCDLLVITDFSDKEKIGAISVNPNEVLVNRDEQAAINGRRVSSVNEFKVKGGSKLRPALFLSGRVHPGETPASWMMKGILGFLTSNSPAAQHLRQEFVVFVVPVLNPDGVIYGNNRCSLAGVDLNRQWKVPVKSLHPTVYALKSFMLMQRRIRDVYMYIDLHGHSRKYNVFMYGCEDKKKPKPQARAFPKFLSMHEVGQKYVNFADCSFQVRKGRESTARVVVAREMNIPCSFTLEATFCGLGYGPLKHCHMNIGHMIEVGAALCDAMLQFCIAEGHVKESLLYASNSRLTNSYLSSPSPQPVLTVANVDERQLANKVALSTASLSSSMRTSNEISKKSLTTILPETIRGTGSRSRSASGPGDISCDAGNESGEKTAGDHTFASRRGSLASASGNAADDDDYVREELEEDADFGSSSGSEAADGDADVGDGWDEPIGEEDDLRAFVDEPVVDLQENLAEPVGTDIAQAEQVLPNSSNRIPRRPYSNDEKTVSRMKSLRQNNLVAPAMPNASTGATDDSGTASIGLASGPILPAFKPSQLPLSSPVAPGNLLPHSILPASLSLGFARSTPVSVGSGSIFEGFRSMPSANAGGTNSGLSIRSLPSPRASTSTGSAYGLHSQSEKSQIVASTEQDLILSKDDAGINGRISEGIAAGGESVRTSTGDITFSKVTTPSTSKKKRGTKINGKKKKKISSTIDNTMHDDEAVEDSDDCSNSVVDGCVSGNSIAGKSTLTSAATSGVGSMLRENSSRVGSAGSEKTNGIDIGEESQRTGNLAKRGIASAESTSIFSSKPLGSSKADGGGLPLVHKVKK